jgi:hypothetical protein
MTIQDPTHSNATMPTKAKKRKTKGDGYIKQAKSANWGTPDRIRSQYRIEDGWADPCPYQHTVDGLLSDWPPVSFVNPPFSDLAQWSRKIDEQVKLGKRVALLMPARVSCVYFHTYLLPNKPRVEFIERRLAYVDLDDSSVKPTCAPFGSIMMHFNEHVVPE